MKNTCGYCGDDIYRDAMHEPPHAKDGKLYHPDCWIVVEEVRTNPELIKKLLAK